MTENSANEPEPQDIEVKLRELTRRAEEIHEELGQLVTGLDELYLDRMASRLPATGDFLDREQPGKSGEFESGV